MTPETDNTHQWLPAAGLALFLSALGVYFYLDGPLVSRRPQESSVVLPSGQEEAVRARLWQDPLHAIYSHWNAFISQDSSSSPSDFPQTITSFANRRARARMEYHYRNDMVLVVTMPGSPYANDREGRRRQRHAVVSALTHNGYVPTDADHLGYFVSPGFGEPAADSGRNLLRDLLLVGYERYERGLESTNATKWNSVLVLWLNAQDFEPHPINQISALLSGMDATPHNTATPTAVFLGPVGSGSLQNMLDEPSSFSGNARDYLLKVSGFPDRLRAWDDLHSDRNTEIDSSYALDLESRAQYYRSTLQVLSTRATVPPKWLLCDRDTPHPACDSQYDVGPPSNNATNTGVDLRVREELGVGWFRSLVARDDEVLRGVIQELVNRGACAKFQNAPSIAIVAEQDTVYGRLFFEILEDIIEDIDRCHFQLIDVGYLRSVDGEIPVENFRPQRDATRSVFDSRPANQLDQFSVLFGTRREPSFGVAQLDYVRRLAERIKDSHLRDQLVAIGVFGSDIYDKLLIFQALREHIRNVVFFTTDIDARLLDFDVRPWTRNIVVGSAYGLDDTNEPAFRDSYQTALFRAVEVSLTLPSEGATVSLWRNAWADSNPPLPSYVWQHEAPPTRVFEVGLTDFVEIAVDLSGVNDDRRWEIFVVLLPLWFLMIFALIMRQRVMSPIARARRRLYGHVSVICALTGVSLAGLAAYLTEDEPFPFFEGVSSVPTIVLQVIAIIFSFSAVTLAYGRIAQAREYLSRSLFVCGAAGVVKGDGTDGSPRVDESLQEAERGPLAERLGVRLTELKGYFIETLSIRLISTWRGSVGEDSEAGRSRVEFWRDFEGYGSQWQCVKRVSLQTLIGFVVVGELTGDASQEQPLVSHWHSILDSSVARTVLGTAAFFAAFYCRDALSVWQAVIWEIGRIENTGDEIEERISSDTLIARTLNRMDIVVRCTELVEPLIVLPLIPMVILMLSRSTIFEGWNWSWEFAVFYLGFVAFVLVGGLRFQSEARRTRELFIDRLRKARTKADGEDARKLQDTIDWVQQRREGAFVPWTQHPILQSVAVPLGGIVIITLLETLLRSVS